MRDYKIIRNGMTTSCGTHDFEEAAQELADALAGGATRLDIRRFDRPGHDRPLTDAEAIALVERATELHGGSAQ